MVKLLKIPIHSFYCIILLCALILTCSVASAQNQRKLNGLVLDSLKEAVPGADVYIIADKDTLNTITDNNGKFSFTGFGASRISLLIMSVGFRPYHKSFSYKTDELVMVLDPISLVPESKLLNEVIISNKDLPIRIKKDTIEYNASFYQTSENDRVEDLLRLLPGVEIDAAGNVTTMGKPLLKLRVNGEDFFTSSVKDFMNQLPANVIDKLQIINDYGDEANFTGIKSGEPQKMLNLVTKEGQNKGTFGNIASSGGTNDRYGLALNGNLWQGSKQVGVNASSNNTNNEAGINTSATTGISYRDKLANGLTASAGYSYAYNKNLSRQLNFIETINPRGGTIFNRSESASNAEDNNHNINFNVQSIASKSYFQASLTGSMSNRNRDGNVLSSQTGLIFQDLNSNNSANSEVPNINGNFVWARSMEKPGRSMSAGIDLTSGINQVNEDLRNQITNFNIDNDLPPEILSVNRLVETENRSNNMTADFRYSEPIGASQDSVIKKNIDFSYFFSLNNTRNSFNTRAFDDQGKVNLVDSLSSLYSSSFILQRFAVSYRYQSTRLNYSLGITAQPSQLTGQYRGNETRINHTELNLSPIINLSYNISDWENLSFVYTGSNTAPDFYQLQPVPNISNLQNVVIGNPNLKSSFTHSGNLTYQHTNAINGSTFQMGLAASVLRDQVVSNVVLTQDTLKSLETRFENANGAYSLGSMYSFAVPFAKNKFNAELRGTFDYNNSISFAEYVLNKNRSIAFAQSLRLKMNLRRLTMGAAASYNYSSNRYSIALLKLRNVETWQFNLNSRAFFGKGFSTILDFSKRINSGYALYVSNPLLINTSIEKTLFKNKQATIALHAYDLLNQGNNLTRIITDNSITDSKFNQITRYFLVSFNYRLQNFGKKNRI